MDNIISKKVYHQYNSSIYSSLWRPRGPGCHFYVVLSFLGLLELVVEAVQNRDEGPKVAGLVVVDCIETADNPELRFLQRKLAVLLVPGQYDSTS